MPRFRINVRDTNELDDLDLSEQVSAIEERAERAERGRGRDDKPPINPLTLQRRQDGRKFGKDVSRIMRERKSPKP